MDHMNLEIPYGSIRSSTAGLLLPFLPCALTSKVCLAIWIVTNVFLVTGNRPYWIYIFVKTIKRDLRIALMMVRSIYTLWRLDKNNMTVAKKFVKLVDKHPNKIAFHTEKRTWTFAEVYDLALRSSHMFHNEGVKRKDAVGLMITNGGGAELPSFWLGLGIIGGIGALLPPLSRGDALIHSIVVAKVTFVLYSDDLAEVFEEIKDRPEMKNIKLFQFNVYNQNKPIINRALCVNSKLKEMPTSLRTEDLEAGRYQDKLIYIYTSGTTGLPKAANISNQRYFTVAYALYNAVGLTPDDVMYTPLPLHHTAGAMLGIGPVLVNGITCALRGKFSASNYWKDCIKYKCTVAQYIGEICRFLLIAAEKSGENNPAGPHCVRMMVGNGLRINIWERFQKTFNIPYIYELYGATESNANMINITQQKGAIGFVPRLLGFLSPIGLIKCDEITGEPIRNEKGLFTPCKPGEPGLMVGKVDNSKRLYTVPGYVDQKSTNSKLLQNVFKKGDCYFNTGDILIMDHLGFYYFKDRTGDTFRWRGENVSTCEVENHLGSILGLSDTVVYGVEIPHIEGRAGMAAIVDHENKLDLKMLKEKLNKALPHYAHPIFIRVISKLEVTVTFKIVKKDLVKEGFNVNQIKDTIYFLDPITSSYILLTPSLYEDLLNGKIRL